MANLLRVVGIFILGLSLQACDFKQPNNLVFVTRPGMGMDKWASTWLIKRHIAPNVEIHWLTNGDDSTNEGVLFDTDKALYKRTGRASTFFSLTQGFNIEIEFLPDLIQLVHDIEINYWGQPDLAYSSFVENQFRRLQAEYGQEKTPMSCYMAFFDKLENELPNLQNVDSEDSLNPNVLIPDPSCAADSIQQKIPRTRLVAEWPIETVLKALQQGKQVVFLDVRESEEFEESHIPGATNLKIRDMRDFDASLVANADLVVPYCVKDFRGFEMARLLKKKGVANVILMRPYGLKGWVAMGLPTATGLAAEEEAIKKLGICANNPENCLKPRNDV